MRRFPPMVVLHTTFAPALSGSSAPRTPTATRLPPMAEPAIRSPLPTTVTLPATELSIMSHQAPGGTMTLPCTCAALSCVSSQVMVLADGILTRACSGRPASESASPTYTVRLPPAVIHCWLADDQYCSCRSGTCIVTTVDWPGDRVTRPNAAS